MRGTGELSIGLDGERFHLAAPSLFWLRPGVPHFYGPDGDEGWTESWVLFDGPATPGYESLGFIPTRQAVQPLHDPLSLMRVLERLADICGDQQMDIDVAAGALIHEFLVTAKRASLTGSTQHDRVLAGLRAEAMRDLSVADRAARLGVSPRQLRLAVRRSAACTPTEFIHRLRVNRAKTLLAETDRPVTEVARSVGFGDPAYFSRHFRASVGLSPRAFRAQQRQFLR
jgi:AraC-like DNA-binding protein